MDAQRPGYCYFLHFLIREIYVCNAFNSPGLHISTFLRQLTFDILYAVEYVILLAFGFSSDVKDLIDQVNSLPE